MGTYCQQKRTIVLASATTTTTPLRGNTSSRRRGRYEQPQQYHDDYQKQHQQQKRYILSSGVQKRIETIIIRHTELMTAMHGSGHTSVGSGKELSLLSPVIKLHSRMQQLIEEEQSVQELVNDAKQSNDTELLEECINEINKIYTNRTKLEQRLIDSILPKDDDDYDSNAIIEIRAGTGGDEASLFTNELLSCYIKTAKSLRWNVEELSTSITDLGGIREATISINGSPTFQYPANNNNNDNDNDADDDNDDDTNVSMIGPYGFFKFESGVHRVQRVPINDVKIQTSACSVAVLPLSNSTRNDTDINKQLPMSELRIETMRSSGAGGQHVNTTDSAVRITHIPTGITASIQDGRSQHQNKDKALKLITARVRDKERNDAAKKLGETRSALMGGGDRSERIRTYNYPQDRISDHRCKETRHGIDTLLSGTGDVINSGLVYTFLPYLKSLHREELLNTLQKQEAEDKDDTKQHGSTSKVGGKKSR